MDALAAHLAEALDDFLRATFPYVSEPGARPNYELRERYRWWNVAGYSLPFVILPVGIVAAGWLIGILAFAWAGFGAEPGAIVVRAYVELSIIAPAFLLGMAIAVQFSDWVLRAALWGSYSEYCEAINAINAMDMQRATRWGKICLLVFGLPGAAMSIDRFTVIGPRSIVSSGYFSIGSTARPTAAVKTLSWDRLAPTLIVRFQDGTEAWPLFGGMHTPAQSADIGAKLSTWTGKPLTPM
ncbi:MAG: hypothetical protein K2X32_15505 [Phycisphaerales bacterium]|nr:hypothetical protein [Phycisphaerales bacterium]